MRLTRPIGGLPFGVGESGWATTMVPSWPINEAEVVQYCTEEHGAPFDPDMSGATAGMDANTAEPVFATEVAKRGSPGVATTIALGLQ